MTAHKTPDQIVPGDIVIPTRGRYYGIQCEVKSVEVGQFGIHRLTVVPTIPTADAWNVDYNERVQVIEPRRSPRHLELQEGVVRVEHADGSATFSRIVRDKDGITVYYDPPITLQNGDSVSLPTFTVPIS